MLNKSATCSIRVFHMVIAVQPRNSPFCRHGPALAGAESAAVPRGIRKRINSAGQPHYQVRYLVRDPASPSGWVETSSTFASLREARAFKADRDGEAAIGARRFDPRLGRTSLSTIWSQYSASKRPAVSPKTWSGYIQHWELRISRASAMSPSTRSAARTYNSSSIP
jgi:hypothetical protein